MRSLAAAVLLAASIAQAQAQQVTTYRGICDGSAAVALGRDHFVVAEDDGDVLFVYERGKPAPAGRADLVDYLGNRKPNGKVKEADIEGAARIRDRIYWIASHGRDSKGKEEPTRLRFFATEIDESSAVPTVRPLATPPYKNLLGDLLAEKKFAPLGLEAAAKKAPEAPDGFNIEGLAATPEGHLLIGLRNPRPTLGKLRQAAVIVPLTNPAEVLAGAKPSFGDALPLDLGARGIRSLERVGDGYVIVAGPFGDGGKGTPGGDFALFRWDGGSTKPVRLKVKLGTLRPEAVFATGSGGLELLSDDGDREIGGEKCKKVVAEKKTYRAMTLPVH